MADKNDLKDVKKPKKDRGEKRKFRRVREIWSELKKVTWPSAGTIIKNTGVVFLVVALFLVVLLIFDVILMVFVFNPLINGELGNPIGASSITALFDSVKAIGTGAGGALKTAFNNICGRLL